LVEDAGQKFLITKGAFENVLAVCAIGEAERAAVQKRFEDLSAQGYRVVAVATGAAAASQAGGAELEADLKLEGLLLFMDPPKQDAAAEIEQLAAQGIQLILITGDNAFVAKSVAGKVGIANEMVLTGAEIAEFTEDQLVERTRDCRVFAAVNPVQKQKIVLALRAAGNTVGFFGDGINDAAAIHAADVGISVDTAVDVAKHAAAIVLLDKNLTVISDGVALGRKTFINTMKYVRVGVSAAFGNMLSMAVAAVFLPFLPLLPVQILLLNFMTDFPALSIAQDSVDDEAVQKPRAWDIKNIRNFMLVFGLISSVFDILTFVILRAGFNAHAELFRSGWFIESTLTELAVMLVLRTRRHFWKSRPGTLLWVSSVILAVLVVVIPFTGIGVALQLEPLSLPLLLSLFGLIAVYVAINEFAKRRFMRD
jgi:Mg2+-importing ATPase